MRSARLGFLLFSSVILLIGLFAVSVPTVPVSGATVGVVCLIASGDSACPSAPASLTAQVGSQLQVSVFIQGSDSIGGFDVTVLADHNILRAMGAEITGSILPSPNVVQKCIGGVVANLGGFCSPTDTLDTIHLAAVEAPGQPLVPAPVTGLLFTAIYNVTGTFSGNTPVGFQSGCASSASSVTGTTTCVTIASGGVIPVPETVETAVFSTSTVPDFFMSASSTSLSLHGAGSSASSKIFVSSLNGFNDNVSLMLSNAVPAGFSASVSPVLLQFGNNGTVNSTLTVTSSSNVTVTFAVQIDGVSGTLVHSITIFVTQVQQAPPNFTLNGPSFTTVKQGGSVSTAVIVSSLGSFSGTVTLTATVFPSISNRPAVVLMPSQLILSQGSTASSTLTISASTLTPAGSYNLTITGSASSIGITHTFIGAILVVASQSDFTINASPSQLTLVQGTTQTSQVTVFPTGPSANFTVALSATSAPQGGCIATIDCHLRVSLNPSTVLVVSGSNVIIPGSSILTVTALTVLGGPTLPGNYTVTVTGTSGGLSHTTTLMVRVLPPPVIRLSPNSGPVGTQVLIQGSGFPAQLGIGPAEIDVSFDNQFVGFIVAPSGSFNFTFNVPVSQAGITHQVIATENIFLNNVISITASAPFQVTPSPSPNSFTVGIDAGSIYFSGDRVTVFLQVSQNGVPVSPSDLQLKVQLINPFGAILQTLPTTSLGGGLYIAAITISSTSPLGTYAIFVSAHSASMGDASALRSFEVKPTWVQGHTTTLTAAAAMVGLVGTLGFAYKKGYFKKSRDEEQPLG